MPEKITNIPPDGIFHSILCSGFDGLNSSFCVCHAEKFTRTWRLMQRIPLVLREAGFLLSTLRHTEIVGGSIWSYFFCLFHLRSLPSLHSLRQTCSCCRQTDAAEVQLTSSQHREPHPMTSLSLTITDYVIDNDVIANVINGAILCVVGMCVCLCVIFQQGGVFNGTWCVWGSVLLRQHTQMSPSKAGVWSVTLAWWWNPLSWPH